MTNPVISVIIPAFNVQDCIGVAIASVKRQDFAGLEVVVVDDGSRDDTMRVAEDALRRHDLPGKVMSRPAGFRKGAGGARNAGAAAARAPVLAFLDSDDEWLPGHLHRAAAALAADDAGPVAYCAYAEVPRAQGMGRIPHTDYPFHGIGDLHAALLEGMIIPNQTLCVRSGAFRRAGGYHEALACYEDWWLVLKLSLLGPFHVDGAFGSRIGVREASLSRSAYRGRERMSPAMFRDALRMAAFASDGQMPEAAAVKLRAHARRFCAEQLAGSIRARHWPESFAICRALLPLVWTMPLAVAAVFGSVIGRLARAAAGRCFRKDAAAAR